MKILQPSTPHIEFCDAAIVTDWNGQIYHTDALKLIKKDHVVRLSLRVLCDDKLGDVLESDAPYVQIHALSGEYLLGEILDIARPSSKRYPIEVGERVWFKLQNVIEIPLKYQTGSVEELKLHLQDTAVPITGPLYTINSDEEYESDETSSTAYDPSEQRGRSR